MSASCQQVDELLPVRPGSKTFRQRQGLKLGVQPNQDERDRDQEVWQNDIEKLCLEVPSIVKMVMGKVLKKETADKEK